MSDTCRPGVWKTRVSFFVMYFRSITRRTIGVLFLFESQEKYNERLKYVTFKG